MKIPALEASMIRFFDSVYRANVERANLQIPFDNLDSGTRVLSNEMECSRYMALYGGHHFHKLYEAYKSTLFEHLSGKDIEIIDWGCGQALATCVLIDYLIEKEINLDVASITLVEPSLVALEAGCGYIRQMFQGNASVDSSVRKINKRIGDLLTTDLVSERNRIKVHLFSNIIDVAEIDLKMLHELVVNSFHERNLIICTSPGNLRKNRLDLFYELFSESHQPEIVTSSSNSIEREIFNAKSGRWGWGNVPIDRYEKQFTVDLIQR